MQESLRILPLPEMYPERSSTGAFKDHWGTVASVPPQGGKASASGTDPDRHDQYFVYLRRCIGVRYAVGYAAQTSQRLADGIRQHPAAGVGGDRCHRHGVGKDEPDAGDECNGKDHTSPQ